MGVRHCPPAGTTGAVARTMQSALHCRLPYWALLPWALLPWALASCGSGGEAVRFTEITKAAGITFVQENGMRSPDGGDHRYVESVGGGLALFDFDGDGWLDIYLVNGNRFGNPDPNVRNALYRNNRDGTFTDVTTLAGVGDPGHGQGATVADYDDDGDLDLYVTNLGPDRFYRNKGDGTFEEVSAQVGVKNDAFGQNCAFLDFDGDGDLDLYVQNYITYVEEQPRSDYAAPTAFRGAADLMFRNDGGRFTEVGREIGIHRPDGRGMGVVCADLDGDRDIDLFIANDGMENYCFENDGRGRFADRSIRSGLAYDQEGNSESSMGADLGDVDGDGDLDIVCPALRAEGCTLYANEGGGTFTDVARAAGLAAFTLPLTGFSPNLIDVDNDGDLDLFLCNGGVATNLGVAATASYLARYGVRDLIAVNDGKGGFADRSAGAGPYFGKALIGRGSAAGDLDNDGDIDIVVNNLAGPAVVLRNDGPQGNWITLDLTRKNGSRNAIHTRVAVTAGGRTQVAVVRAAGSYLSINDRRPHFGIGTARSIDRIDITWPDGTTQTLGQVEPNRILPVKQTR